MESELNCTSNHGTDHLCNCDDSNDNDIDLGTLRGFDQLPVMGLFYGDSESRHSWLQYDLGRLHCSGQKAPFPSQSVFMEQIENFWFPLPSALKGNNSLHFHRQHIEITSLVDKWVVCNNPS